MREDRYVDPNRVAGLARAWRNLPSRRDILRGLFGTGLGATPLPAVIEARKKGKHRKSTKNVKPNAFGCLSVGTACGHDGQCCSGICQGKAGKKRCQLHGAGTCDQEAEGFCTAADPAQTACNGSDHCACIRTTGGNQFCADFAISRGGACADCQTDADCEALGFLPGSACVPFTEGICPDAVDCAFGTFCLPSCPHAPPET
jgi:hypothetical protein